MHSVAEGQHLDETVRCVQQGQQRGHLSPHDVRLADRTPQHRLVEDHAEKRPREPANRSLRPIRVRTLSSIAEGLAVRSLARNNSRA